jgi:hypothetical protein
MTHGNPSKNNSIVSVVIAAFAPTQSALIVGILL